MWTLAASLSTQFQHIQDSLYTSTKRMLETIELNDNRTESLNMEQVQAWVLLTIYEFMRVSYRRGWMSAGRVFRLVQLMRLYEVDEFGATEPTPACIVSEEKRRCFWVAYLLDRLVSIRNGRPLTLVEQIVSTRLPAPEMDFQSSKPFQTSFLSEAIALSEHTTVSSFQKCIIVVTICGRAVTHHQQSKVECVYKNVSEDFWNRHQWLETLLAQQELIISLEYPSASEHVDPTMLFIDMMVHATVLYLYKVVESMPWKIEYYQESVLNCQQRALIAALHMITLTKALSQLSCFKVNLSLAYFRICLLVAKDGHNHTPFPFSFPILTSNITMIRSNYNGCAADPDTKIKNNRSTLSHPSSYFSARNSSSATPTSMIPYGGRSKR